MKRINTYKLAAAVLVLTLTPAILLAQPPGRGGGFRQGGPMGQWSPIDRLDERLDLTEEQREAIEGIFDAYSDDLELQGQAARDAHEALAASAREEVFDEEAIRVLGQDLGAAQAEVTITRARLHLEIRQQLTPEQQELFDQRMERRPFGPRGGRGYGHRGRGFRGGSSDG